MKVKGGNEELIDDGLSGGAEKLGIRWMGRTGS